MIKTCKHSSLARESFSAFEWCEACGAIRMMTWAKWGRWRLPKLATETFANTRATALLPEQSGKELGE
jgi:hypothetical protein